ncbi:hypothetical protein PIB30_046907 [Stylosanthes scabra]|uniref:Uncharacterized protein n=1 Tax=Stylosanthes scabra TaxID=79078 RepID=A0ABU6VGM4_9FABA|nr:hypothetical protein [Stylosanthes scabra]
MGRKHEEGNSKGKFEDDKARKKIELKCTSVDDLISKLKAFKGALHNNKNLNTHLGARSCDPTAQPRGPKISFWMLSVDVAPPRAPMRAIALPACSSSCDRAGPKTKQNGPPIKARDRASGSCDRAVTSAA